MQHCDVMLCTEKRAVGVRKVLNMRKLQKVQKLRKLRKLWKLRRKLRQLIGCPDVSVSMEQGPRPHGGGPTPQRGDHRYKTKCIFS